MTATPRRAADAAESKPNPWWRWAFAVAVAVQLVALYAPDAAGGPEINGLDKVVHASIFAAPAFAALMLRVRTRWVVGLLVAHAPLSELIQHWALSQREGDVFDVAADIAGLLFGGLAYVVWNRRQH